MSRVPSVWVAAIALAAGLTCSPGKELRAQDATESEIARTLLASLQAESFERNREICGKIGLTRDGTFVVSRPHVGGRNGCWPRRPGGARQVTASYHTHGGFDPGTDSELPSPQDVYSDMHSGTNGYVATPGGRFWYIDGTSGSVYQLCAPGCLPSDPRFMPGLFGEIRAFYTLEQLEQRLAGF